VAETLKNQRQCSGKDFESKAFAAEKGPIGESPFGDGQAEGLKAP
jgi:hypothetical protein